MKATKRLRIDCVFFTPNDSGAFLTALGLTKRRYPFLLFGYCLKTDHFHLLLQAGFGAEHQPQSAIADRGAHVALP